MDSILKRHEIKHYLFVLNVIISLSSCPEKPPPEIPRLADISRQP